MEMIQETITSSCRIVKDRALSSPITWQHARVRRREGVGPCIVADMGGQALGW
jgi:hypothetical protein